MKQPLGLRVLRSKRYAMMSRWIRSMAIVGLLALPGVVSAQGTLWATRSGAQDASTLLSLPGKVPTVCNKPYEVGRSEHLILSEGSERRYLLHVPAAYNGHQRLPLVIDLHGSTSSPEQELSISGMDKLAEEEKFVVVAPAGIGSVWNVPINPEMQDDVQFISDVIDALARCCAYRNRASMRWVSLAAGA